MRKWVKLFINQDINKAKHQNKDLFNFWKASKLKNKQALQNNHTSLKPNLFFVAN